MINKAIILGRIGRVSLSSPAAPVKFSVATSSSHKNKAGEWETETTWHNVVAWGDESYKKSLSDKLSDAIGAMVYVEGKIEIRDWATEEEPDVKRRDISIRAEKVSLLPTNKGGAKKETGDAPASKSKATAAAEDALPFK